jgi:hypothetical protein
VPGAKGDFGRWLIEELPARGIGITEFARQMDIDPSTIHRWTKRDPELSLVGKAAQLLGCDYHELVERFHMSGRSRRKTRNNDDEAEHVRRTIEELAAYPDDVFQEILARVEAERRKQEESNRKDS